MHQEIHIALQLLSRFVPSERATRSDGRQLSLFSLPRGPEAVRDASYGAMPSTLHQDRFVLDR